MAATIASIVEGHGEVEAVPALIRRIARTLDPGLQLNALRPTRKSRGGLLRPGGLETEVEVAARRIGGQGAIFVLIDSDDCPRDLAPALLSRAKAARGDLPLGVVMAHREYEAWFLESAVSLRGCHGLPADLDRPTNPNGSSRAEVIRSAKGWIEAQTGRKYLETSDQPALTHRFSLTLARRARSFDKCYRDIVTLLRALVPSAPSSDAENVVICCAQRMDHDSYRRSTGFDPWPGIEHFLRAGAWSLPSDGLWATFASLRTGLCRWSIGQEPRYNGLWCAFRSLFLLVAELDPPLTYRVAPAEEEWRAEYLPHLAYHLELVREIHEQSVYENGALESLGRTDSRM